MAIPKITPLPTAMNRMRPDSFSVDSDNYFGALEQKFAPELNATVDSINTTTSLVDSKAATVASTAINVAATADVVALTANVSPWVSGTNYSKNQCTISQVNFQTYRRKIAGSGTTDPINDSVNWTLLVGNGAFNPVAQNSTSFDLSVGNYFKRTLNGNETWTFSNIPQDGYSWTVEITHTSGVLTLPTSVKTPNNIAYTFTAGKTHLLMFVTSNKGARIRLVAANNYDN